MKILLTIPTYNAGGLWGDVIDSIKQQSIKLDKVVVIDSSSTDNTLAQAKEAGFECISIEQKEFNHGLTRMISVEKYSDYDIAVFMTQDAILADSKAIENLISEFTAENVSVAYGRQLVREGAPLLERSMRLFNYPAISRVKTMQDKQELGLSTAFCSNSFSAYRIADLLSIGGFGRVSFGEDMLTTAKLLQAGKSCAYVAEATVYHSHAYDIVDEFKRGIAIGKMHKENEWLLKLFGSAEKRGGKLFSSVKIYQKPLILLQALPKFIGYKIGRLK